ncbi:sensor histidine kinase [Marinospirillum perlucidum]|uniref:sensor histidine kinase n=1 Tax=Marinospirillum perlucidum TaxID=1982602 RepID=UPI000DF3C847|nr:sensor histidine kinase [Marinospirillum perlucidum]
MAAFHPRNWSLQKRLSLLLAGCFIIITVLSAILVKAYFENEYRSLFLKREQEQIRLVVQRIEQNLETRLRWVEAHADRLADVEGLLPLASIREHLKAAQVGSGFSDLSVMNPEGVVLIDQPVFPGRVGTDYSFRSFISRSLTEKTSVISSLLIGAKTRRPMYVMAAPIFDEREELVGLLVASTDLREEALFKRLGEEMQDQDSRLLVLDPINRLYIASSNPDQVLQPLPEPGAEPLLDRLLDSTSRGTLEDEQGEAWIFVNEYMEPMHWLVVKLASERAVLMPVRNLISQYLLLTLLMLVIMGCLTIYLVHYLLRPVRQAIAQINTAVNQGGGLQPFAIQRQDEIGQLLQAFNALEQMRDRQDRMKEEFISLVSHELRTPLTSIQGSLSLLTSAQLGEPEREEMLSIAERNTGRLLALVNDLLDLASLARGSLRLEMRQQSLKPILDEVLCDFSPQAKAKQIELDLEMAAEDIQVKVDYARLQQVMNNLLSNAVKFSPEGTRVSIQVSTDKDEWVRISVKDEGEGIPLGFQSRVFERFAQADASDRRRHGGTGLGLSITRELVAAMQGRMGFSSLPHQGSCFYLELPRYGLSTTEES